MDRARESGRQWREDMEPWLVSRGIITLNPYDKPLLESDNALEDDDSFVQMHKAKELGLFTKASQLMKPIRKVDLRMVDHCDFIIVNLDMKQEPCGTWEELFLANREMKPIVTHCAQGKKNMPNWLFAVFPHELMFDSWDEVKEYLRHIDEDEHVDHLSRWHFFDIEDKVRQILLNKDKGKLIPE